MLLIHKSISGDTEITLNDIRQSKKIIDLEVKGGWKEIVVMKQH